MADRSFSVIQAILTTTSVGWMNARQRGTLLHRTVLARDPRHVKICAIAETGCGTQSALP